MDLQKNLRIINLVYTALLITTIISFNLSKKAIAQTGKNDEDVPDSYSVNLNWGISRIIKLNDPTIVLPSLRNTYGHFRLTTDQFIDEISLINPLILADVDDRSFSNASNSDSNETTFVSGQLIRDFDNNGIQNQGEIGIDNITIVLFKDGQAVATTTTKHGGFYLFENLLLGKYYVQIQARIPNAIKRSLVRTQR